MTAPEVLSRVQAAGHKLTVVAGQIHVTPPCSDELATLIVKRRNGLMRLLGDTDRPSPMTEAMHEYRDRLAAQDAKRGFVWTGYRDLDFLTGGTGPGYLTIVAASIHSAPIDFCEPGALTAEHDIQLEVLP